MCDLECRAFLATFTSQFIPLVFRDHVGFLDQIDKELSVTTQQQQQVEIEHGNRAPFIPVQRHSNRKVCRRTCVGTLHDCLGRMFMLVMLVMQLILCEVLLVGFLFHMPLSYQLTPALLAQLAVLFLPFLFAAVSDSGCVHWCGYGGCRGLLVCHGHGADSSGWIAINA